MHSYLSISIKQCEHELMLFYNCCLFLMSQHRNITYNLIRLNRRSIVLNCVVCYLILSVEKCLSSAHFATNRRIIYKREWHEGPGADFKGFLAHNETLCGLIRQNKNFN